MKKNISDIMKSLKNKMEGKYEVYINPKEVEYEDVCLEPKEIEDSYMYEDNTEEENNYDPRWVRKLRGEFHLCNFLTGGANGSIDDLDFNENPYERDLRHEAEYRRFLLRN